MFILYQITNTLNGKTYIGAHEGNSDDGYFGSGVALANAIRCYGKDSFTKSVLLECESKEEMFTKERELVNEEFVSRRDTYNLKLGGLGGSIKGSGCGYPKGLQHTDEHKSHIAGGLRKAYQTGNRKSTNGIAIHSEEYKQRLRQQMIGNQFSKGWPKGKPRKPVILNTNSQPANF